MGPVCFFVLSLLLAVELSILPIFPQSLFRLHPIKPFLPTFLLYFLQPWQPIALIFQQHLQSQYHTSFLLLSHFLNLWIPQTSLILANQRIVSVLYSVLCSRVIHHLYNFTPWFWFFQNKIYQRQVLFYTEIILLLWLVQVVVPSLTTWFWRPEYSPFSLEKHYFCHVVPIIKDL